MLKKIGGLAVNLTVVRRFFILNGFPLVSFNHTIKRRSGVKVKD